MRLTQALIGTWRGCAFPTQETALIFCPDGKGLLFFYWGSIGAPILDEFAWSVERDGQLNIVWTVRHDLAEDGSPNPMAVSGGSEVLPYEMLSEPSRALRIDIGMHAGFDTPLEYIGGVTDSSDERKRWQLFAEKFDPFGPGRQMWTVDDQNRWHPM